MAEEEDEWQEPVLMTLDAFISLLSERAEEWDERVAQGRQSVPAWALARRCFPEGPALLWADADTDSTVLADLIRHDLEARGLLGHVLEGIAESGGPDGLTFGCLMDLAEC